MLAGSRSEKVVTAVLVVCALVVTTVVVRRELRDTATITDEPPPLVKEVMAWRSYAEGAALSGPADAPVTIVEFSDFQCPFCDSARKSLAEVQRQFPRQVRVIYRHRPLTAIHSEARSAAVASECAAEQGRFSEIHDLLFDHAEQLDTISYDALAQRANVPDLRAFQRCVEEDHPATRLHADSVAADRLGIRGTPTLLINSRLFVGALSSEELAEHVRAALETSAEVR